jgi:hypothetical protein
VFAVKGFGTALSSDLEGSRGPLSIPESVVKKHPVAACKIAEQPKPQTHHAESLITDTYSVLTEPDTASS